MENLVQFINSLSHIFPEKAKFLETQIKEIQDEIQGLKSTVKKLKDEITFLKSSENKVLN